MEPGFYYLRASPAVDPIGGMYATSEGSDLPVRVAARVPPLEERQIVSRLLQNYLTPLDLHTLQWRVEIISRPGEPLKVHIILAFSDLHVVQAWSPIGEKPEPDCPVILSADVPKHITWTMEKINIGVVDAWEIGRAHV